TVGPNLIAKVGRHRVRYPAASEEVQDADLGLGKPGDRVDQEIGQIRREMIRVGFGHGALAGRGKMSLHSASPNRPRLPESYPATRRATASRSAPGGAGVLGSVSGSTSAWRRVVRFDPGAG